MRYLEAPNNFDDDTFEKIDCEDNKLFLAGSITGAWNWQKEITPKLIDRFHIFNPRRENFNVSDPSVEREQISWEHYYLDFADIVLFYFSHETFAPITLLELGTLFEEANRGEKKVFICIHPDYKRKNDVIIQTELRAPNILKNICYNLDDLVKLVRGSIK